MTATPFHFSPHSGPDCRNARLCTRRQGMPDDITLPAHINYGKPAQGSYVVWLSTTCGVERRAIERHNIVTAGNHRCFERRKICVAKEEQFGQ